MKMFTPQEEKNLSYLLAKTSNQESDFDLEELHGMLFGLAITPELIPIEEWLSFILGDEPEFDDEENAKTCVGHLMGAYNRIMHDGNEGKLRFPFNYKKLTELEFSLISGWAYGLFLVLSLRPDIWGMSEKYQKMADDEIPEKLQDVIGACVIITGVAFPEEMASIAADMENDDEESAEDIEDGFYQMLPASVGIIQKYGKSLMKEILPGGIHPAAYQEPRKVGRNDACPCGSGKKYKKCCGAN